MQGLEVDFLKMNDTFLGYTKKILFDKYRVSVDQLSIESQPKKHILIIYKNNQIIVPIIECEDKYLEVNNTFKSIIKTILDQYPEDFI